MDVWIRLPEYQGKCPHTGLGRTALDEILNEMDPLTGEKSVKSIEIIPAGTERWIKLINFKSLLEYVDRKARAQSGLHFADHV